MDNESTSRRIGIIVFGAIFVIFLLISAASFAPNRARTTPGEFAFQSKSAEEGKRVFQAYNCMGCHTILGNGAYFGPDLTKVYEDGGAAWLKTFLPSPGTWPTKAALNLMIERLKKSGDVDIASTDAYYEKYPHVLEAVELFGGQRTNMPNITIQAEEISALVAFLNYITEINTQGWPPASQADARVIDQVLTSFGVTMPKNAPAAPAVTVVPTSASTVARGQKLANDLGCLACHSTDGSKKVGATWKGLFGATVQLLDGKRVVVDEAYLKESILQPDAKIVQGYAPGTMPSFEGQIAVADVDALIAFIASLK